MGKFIVEIKPTAKKDLAKHKKSGNKAANAKIIKMLDELLTHPYTGTGQPE
jgi:toxin YoeB